MVETEPRRESAGQKPFVIRGHRLRVYADLIKHNIDPLELSLLYVEDVGLHAKKSKREAEYSKDMLGFPSQADNFIQQTASTFKTFSQLPSDYPVQIVEGINDNICEWCVVGKHCRKLEEFAGDSVDIDSFVKKLDKFHLQKPVISYESAFFSDQKQLKQVRRVETTAGIVKQVIRKDRNLATAGSIMIRQLKVNLLLFKIRRGAK